MFVFCLFLFVCVLVWGCVCFVGRGVSGVECVCISDDSVIINGLRFVSSGKSAI